jgi:hypothetical protein
METRNRNAEEIDLLYFFNPLFRGLKRMGRGFYNYLLLLKRNFLLFSTIFIVIAALGYGLRYVLPKSYKTSAIFVSYNLPASWCTELVNSLNSFTGNGQKAKALAEQLKISLPSASTIHSISADSLKNLNGLDTVYSTAFAFEVNILVKDKEALPEIQKGLQAYLETNPFSLKRKEARQKKLEDLRRDLVMRINSLDSLKEVLSKNIVSSTGKQGIILGVPVSPVEAYQVQREYYRQLKDLEEKLSLLQNIDVVQPFIMADAPNYPDFRKIFLYAALIGLLAALLATPILGRRKV